MVHDLHSKSDLGGKTSSCMALGMSEPVKHYVLERTTGCFVFTAVFYEPSVLRGL